MKKYRAGVLFGDELEALYNNAKENQFALPAVNTIGTNTINATLETAAKVNSPVIIQFSNGGAPFIAGKGMPNENLQGNIAGGISGALHIHNVAKYYGVPVVLHTDHAAKKWLPWISGLIDAGEQFYKEKGQPLFSSHMLDRSEEPIEENIHPSVEFYKRMSPLGMSIEIELGVTGGEEDGVDNSDVENSKLYTKPEDVAYAYRELSKVGKLFTVAGGFGNVHGVYKPGNVVIMSTVTYYSYLLVPTTVNFSQYTDVQRGTIFLWFFSIFVATIITGIRVVSGQIEVGPGSNYESNPPGPAATASTSL